MKMKGYNNQHINIYSISHTDYIYIGMVRFDILADKNFGKKNILIKLWEHYLWASSEELIRNNTHVPEHVYDSISRWYNQYTQDHRPLEYIIGQAYFDTRLFRIDERAMIPRPETEYMIAAVNESIVWPATVIDLWSGCGVLWQSIYLDNPWLITLIQTDISHPSLDLARTNAKNHNVEALFVQWSLLEPVSRDISWDIIIIANLPYIPEDTFDQNVAESAKRREPRLAFVWWPDGLDRYRDLFGQLAAHPYKQWVILYLEMMTRQVEILHTEFPHLIYEIKKTFHFNIVIVEYKI